MQRFFFLFHLPEDNLMSLSFLDNLCIFIEEGHRPNLHLLRFVNFEHLAMIVFLHYCS